MLSIKAIPHFSLLATGTTSSPTSSSKAALRGFVPMRPDAPNSAASRGKWMNFLDGMNKTLTAEHDPQRKAEHLTYLVNQIAVASADKSSAIKGVEAVEHALGALNPMPVHFGIQFGTKSGNIEKSVGASVRNHWESPQRGCFRTALDHLRPTRIPPGDREALAKEMTIRKANAPAWASLMACLPNLKPERQAEAWSQLKAMFQDLDDQAQADLASAYKQCFDELEAVKSQLSDPPLRSAASAQFRQQVLHKPAAPKSWLHEVSTKLAQWRGAARVRISTPDDEAPQAAVVAFAKNMRNAIPAEADAVRRTERLRLLASQLGRLPKTKDVTLAVRAEGNAMKKHLDQLRDVLAPYAYGIPEVQPIPSARYISQHKLNFDFVMAELKKASVQGGNVAPVWVEMMTQLPTLKPERQHAVIEQFAALFDRPDVPLLNTHHDSFTKLLDAIQHTAAAGSVDMQPWQAQSIGLLRKLAGNMHQDQRRALHDQVSRVAKQISEHAPGNPISWELPRLVQDLGTNELTAQG